MTALTLVLSLIASLLVGVGLATVATVADPMLSTPAFADPPPSDPPTTISLAADNASFAAGSHATLTATTDQDVADTSSVVTITDETTSTALTTCDAGSTCTATTSFDTGGSHTYVATVNDLTSNEVTVSREPWTVTLSSDKTSFDAGEDVTLTATANQSVSNTDGHYRIEIFDETSDQQLTMCSVGDTCTYGPAVLFTSGTPHSVVAVVEAWPSEYNNYSTLANPEATSDEISIARSAWTVTLSTDKTSFTPGDSVNLTATANQDPGHTAGHYYVFIYDETTGDVLIACNSGTVCTYTSSSLFAVGPPHTYIAAVAGSSSGGAYEYIRDEQATSDEVTVARDAPWSIALTTSETTFSTGDTVTFTATANQDVGTTDHTYRIDVFDTTTGDLVEDCLSGSICTFGIPSQDLFTSGDPHNYIAVVNGYSSDSHYADLTDPQASSNTVTLSRALWTLSLTTNQSVVKTSETATLTAVANQSVGPTEGAYQIDIWDTTTGQMVGYCGNIYNWIGNTCSTQVGQYTNGPDTYVALVVASQSVEENYSDATDIQATSNGVTEQMAAWSLSLTGSSDGPYSYGLPLFDIAHMNPGANQPTEFTPYQLVVMNETAGRIFLEGDEYFPISAPAPTFYAAVGRVDNSTSPPSLYDIQAISAPFTPQLIGPPRPSQTQGGQNPATGSCECSGGDPVNTATGEFYTQSTEDSLPGVGPAVAVERTYSSNLAEQDGPFGYGWAPSFDSHMAVITAGNSLDPMPRQVEITQENGSTVDFNENPDHTYSPPLDVFATLSYDSDSDRWTFVRRATETMVFNSDYQLHSSVDAHGNAVLYHRNGSGKVDEISGGGGRSIDLTWSGNHVTGLTDSAGRSTSYSYDTNGNLVSATDVDGNTTTYGYDSNHLLLTLTKPGGGVTTNTYDGVNRVVQQVNAAGRTTFFDYGSGEAEVVAPDSTVTRDTYLNGQLTSETTGYGTADAETTNYFYDAMNNLLSTTDPLGHVTSYTYDAFGNTLTQTDPLDQTTTWTYDALNDVTSVTDPMDRETLSTYDSTGDRLSTTTAGGETLHWTYNSDGTLATSVDGRGKTTHYSYNSAGEPTSVTDPDGRETQTAYNPAGVVTSSTDAAGHVTTMTSNAGGQVLTTTDPNSHTTMNVYDADGNLVSTETPGGNTTTNHYNLADQLTSTVDAAGNTTTDTYTPNGQLATTTDANSDTTTDAYDDRGLLVSVTAPNGEVVHYGYDADGQKVSTTDPSGADETLTYDADGRVTSSTDALGKTTSYTYDADGETISTTDPLGRVTGATYNADGQVSAVTLPDSSVETYGYNGTGQTTSFVNADGKTTSYAYDDAGLMTSKTEPGSQTTSYTYTDAGLPHVVTLPDSSTETDSYDAGGQLTGIHYSATGSTDTTYGYNADGQRTSMTDATGTSSYTYNSVGEMTAETNGAGLTLGYAYDPVGNLTSIAYPGSNTVNYTYNNVDEMTSETDWSSNETDFSWTTDGQLASQASANGMTQDRTYDADGQTTDISTKAGSTTLADFTYGYDDAGELTSDSTVDPNNSTPITHTYNYDNLNQLTTVASGGSTASYASTSAGEQTSDTLGNSLSYNSAQELTDLTPTSGAASSYTYDDNGSRTSSTVAATDSLAAATTSYEYDPAGDLASVSVPAVGSTAAETVDYTSDGDGLRQTRTVGTTTKDFLWSTVGSIPLLLDDGTNSYIYGPSSSPIAMVSDSTGGIHYLSSDLVGSTRLISNSAGTVNGVNRYDEYGNVASHTGTSTSAIGYSGNWTDPDTGLIYMRARDYDPATAQFLTVDPLVDSTRMPYAYVANNPLDGADPTGLCQTSEWWNPFSWSGDTWQSIGAIAAGAVVFAGVVAGVAALAGCAALTFGACGVVAVLGGMALAGLASGVVTYALDPGPKSGTGFAEAAGFGAVGGLVGGVVGAIGGKILGAVGPRIVSALSDGASSLLGKGVDSAVSDGVSDAVDDGGDSAASCLLPQSFTPSTGVMLANGKTISIDKIKIGEKVRAVNVKTGKKVTRAVTAVWINKDTDLMDVTVREADGTMVVIHATQHHLFWDATTHSWVEADKFAVGDQLQANNGSTNRFESAAVIPGAADMWDLTVEGVHDFYVSPDSATTVLVHNEDCGNRPPNLTPDGAGRSGAFNQAKRDAGIPTSQQPSYQGPNLARDNETVVPGRRYVFSFYRDDDITIRDDNEGHIFFDDPTQNRGPHFNGPGGGHYDY